MANLFKVAKEKGATAASKGTDKTEVVIHEPEFHGTLTRLAEVNTEIDNLNAEAASLAGIVKERGIKEFGDLYSSKGKYPGSFLIKATGLPSQPSASLMFIPTDKYIKIDEARATELQETYGDAIVTENTVYTMDAKLVEKYGEEISKAINAIKTISTADKEALIKATPSYTVSKGTISNLTDYKGTIPTLLEDIHPVYQLKGIKID